MDQQGTQVSVSAFADPKQAGSAATGSLFGNKSKPSRKLPSVLEASPVTNSGDQRCSRYRPDPFNPANTLAHLVGAKEVSDALGIGADVLVGRLGADTFLFNGEDVGTGVDTISDFCALHNDQVDLAGVLSAYDPTTHNISDFLEIWTANGDTTLRVDIDGGGNNFVELAIMENVTLSSNAQTAIDDGLIIL